MKKILSVVFCICFFGTTFAQTADSGLPANPEPGKCYVKCVTPDQYETVEEKVMTRPAYRTLKVIPAVYETREERVLVKEATTKYEFVPAIYETVYVDYEAESGHEALQVVPASFGEETTKIEVTPKISRWEYQPYEGCKSEDPMDCQVLCWKEYPAQYETQLVKTLISDASTKASPVAATTKRYAKQVITKKAEIREIEVPAEYKMIKKRVLVKDEVVEEVTVPAEYATVRKERLVNQGGITVWEEVACELLDYTVLPINYEYNSARLTSKARTIIAERLLKMMKDKPHISVEISAHTDSRGSADANQELSERRARSVVNYLIGKGVNSSRLVAKGYGEARLKNRCSDGVSCTEAEHAVNRRTEFRIINNTSENLISSTSK